MTLIYVSTRTKMMLKITSKRTGGYLDLIKHFLTALYQQINRRLNDFLLILFIKLLRL